jgi:hypothetical protein
MICLKAGRGGLNTYELSTGLPVLFLTAIFLQIPGRSLKCGKLKFLLEQIFQK